MYSTALKDAIATTPVHSQVSDQESTLTQPCIITTPQRKARVNDKNRLKWKDAKETALAVTDCADTVEVKKWLKVLKVQLSLRLTSGWVAVSNDLVDFINNAKKKSAPQVASNIVHLQGYKLGARSYRDCAKNFKMVQQYKTSEVNIKTQDFLATPEVTRLFTALDTFVDRITPPSDFEIVLKGVKDAIASSNWEFLRLALINREQHKAAAWKMLSPQEQQQLDALIPQPIRLLKEAVKRGAIAAWKEDDEGGIFHVWESVDSLPQLVTGTSVARKFHNLTSVNSY